ncbi:MAG TPA: imidazoleglycerol-phosphate dehydratase HisB [Clostridiaceae bacterium]|nr:imidazoleglycerol-phosphate dehydratase HisB [Clostridiaceae bacterium]
MSVQHVRQSTISRKTGETDLILTLNLDGTGKSQVDTGIGFFDHMLTLFAYHGGLDLNLKVQSADLHVDGHHLVEDTGIVLGKALAQALGDKAGIRRYGSMYLPMDETLVRAVLDLSGRPFLVFNANFKAPMCGNFDTQLTVEFFRAIAFNGLLTLHIDVLTEGNTHHEIEGIFKAFGRALRQAAALDERVQGIPSTKGLL